MTGRMCFLVCMTGHAAAVEPGGQVLTNEAMTSETARHNGIGVVPGVKLSSHNALPIVSGCQTEGPA